jgi:subtilisin family serine protease
MPGISLDAVSKEQIIVRYKPGVDVSSIKNRAMAEGANDTDELTNMRMMVLKVPAATRDSVIERLRADPRFEFVEPDTVATIDYTQPNDTQYSKQWIWPKTTTDIAWDRTKGSASMVVAVVDSGVNTTHPDLQGKLTAGIDYVDNDNDPNDALGHGTNVAGVVAANTNNGAGVASGCWSCKIMPVRVVDANEGTSAATMAKGLQYAADNGAKVITMSISTTPNNSTLQTAVDYVLGKGVVLVTSAGNNAYGDQKWPAASPNVIGVAATDKNDKLASYSNFGSHVKIAAPGEVVTTRHPTDYTIVNGTSFSTPAIASIIALMWSAFPNATPAQLRTAITSTADPCCDGKIGGGRVNAARAMAYLAGNGTVADTTKPTINVTTPTEGATVGGNPYHITGTVSDNVAVSKLQIQLDELDPFVPQLNGVNFDITWNTTSFANGSTHVLKLTAFDSSGNASTVVTRNVTVNNSTNPNPPNPPPTNPPPTNPPPPNPNPKSADINGSGKVDLTDLSILLSNWNKNTAAPDLNSNGKVDLTDLSMLLSKWNTAG